MDNQKRYALLVKVGDLEDTGNRAVWVEVEEFFDGNDDLASFWCNLSGPPKELSQVSEFLRAIRSRIDVDDVLVCVTQFDGGKEEWPFSDTVLVVTDASTTDVQDWFDRFPPDEAFAEEDENLLSDLGYPGRAAVRLWWD
ncbi:MAG: hypothetical protein ABJO67_06745 [Pseudoruegeria sp.]